MRAIAPLHDLFDFCFPRRCVLCEELPTGAEPLCEGCAGQLSLQAVAAACERCAAPIHAPNAPCPWCKGDGHKPIERIARLGVYEDPLSRMIKQLKYHHAWPLAEVLANRALQHPAARNLIDDAEVIVPVPLHPWRHLSRGYNQAELIARRIAKTVRKPIREPLVRLKHTETQTHFHSRQHREQNLRGAFGLMHPKHVRSRRVLLIDDVMTTSATLKSAARSLKEGEPTSIDAIVLAVADPRGHAFTSV